VAREVGGLAVAVRGLDAHEHVVLHERLEQAVVRVVRRAQEREGPVVAEDVAIEALPVAARIGVEGVADLDGSEEPLLREQVGRARDRAEPRHRRQPEKLPSPHGALLAPAWSASALSVARAAARAL
jgi:hypothetical protein